MILEPDSLALAGIVGLLTAVLWLTPLRATVFSAPAKPKTRPPHLLQSRRGTAVHSGRCEGS